jgi:hypothetical protein
MFGFVDPGARVRRDNPLRTIREIVNAALNDLSNDFGEFHLSRESC